MAGHSQFKNIMHRKNIQDAKKAKVFTKVTREIGIAVQEGKSTDPNVNAKLRSALLKARAIGLPKEKINKAMDNTNHKPHEYIRYSAHVLSEIGLIIECSSDNKNRIASEMRTILGKHNAKIQPAEHMFRHLGCIKLACELSDELTERSLLAGAEEIMEKDSHVHVFFKPENFTNGKAQLLSFGDPAFDGMYWLPVFTKQLSDTETQELVDLIDDLENNDDVQDVWTNVE